jgi:hypothetical protein
VQKRNREGKIIEDLRRRVIKEEYGTKNREGRGEGCKGG